jgi:hypothetical protein
MGKKEVLTIFKIPIGLFIRLISITVQSLAESGNTGMSKLLEPMANVEYDATERINTPQAFRLFLMAP